MDGQLALPIGLSPSIELPDRILVKIALNVDTGCWEWTASRNNRGYGKIGVGGAAGGMQYAHRVVYELLVGPIPERHEIDHLCRVRHCVNPEHMETVTHAENVARSMHPNIVAHRTGVCVSGLHEMTGDNLYINPGSGLRCCRACRDIRRRGNRDA